MEITAPRCTTKAWKSQRNQADKDCCPQVGRKPVSELLDEARRKMVLHVDCGVLHKPEQRVEIGPISNYCSL